jgi:hypothetical protein
LLGIVTLGNTGIVTLQPAIQDLFCTLYGWHTGPQSIVKIEGNDINLV